MQYIDYCFYYVLVYQILHCPISLTEFYHDNFQRDLISSHLDGGGSAGEEGVEDAFELLHEINERVRTGLWVGDCFIYNNSTWRLNYCVGGEVRTNFTIIMITLYLYDI
jgi:hypothetical protein